MSVFGRLEELSAAFWAHVGELPVREPACVTFDPQPEQIDVQVGVGGPVVDRLADLIVWARSLDEVTAELWHTDSGSLHITVEGRTSGGTRFRVYLGLYWPTIGGVVALERGATRAVSIDVLEALRDVLLRRAEAAHVGAGGAV